MGFESGTEVRPQFGRWNWPFTLMKEGQWFVVDHAEKDPEDVRNYVSVRAAQLNRRFSVEREDPDRPGYCRVTRVGWDAARASRGARVLEYSSAAAKFNEWFGINIEGLPYHLIFGWRWAQIEVSVNVQPPAERVVFKVHPMTIGAIFNGEIVRLVRLPPFATVESWEANAERWEEDRKRLAKEEDQRTVEELRKSEVRSAGMPRLLTSYCEPAPSLKDLMS